MVDYEKEEVVNLVRNVYFLILKFVTVMWVN